MRRSPLSHPLAVLRTTLGLTQKQMGDLVDRAARTIQSIELGNLKLCEELALRIAHETAVDVAWLLAGDPNVPPRRGMSAYNLQTFPLDHYSRDDYEQHRAWLEVQPDPTPEKELRQKPRISLAEAKTMALGMTLRARKRADREIIKSLRQLLNQTAPDANGDLVRWKVRQALTGLTEEFTGKKKP